MQEGYTSKTGVFPGCYRIKLPAMSVTMSVIDSAIACGDSIG